MRENPDRRIAGGGLWGADLLIFDRLASTNTWALGSVADLKNGDVIRAIKQTGGKGRFDRLWVSPGKCCLTLSAIVKPGSGGSGIPDPLYLSVAALAVRDTLKEFGVDSMLKWPNDVMTERGKISGILAEKDVSNNAIVLGAGININITAPALAGMIFEPRPVSMAVERDRLFDTDLVCKRLLVHLEKNIDSATLNGPAYIGRRWNEADFLSGRDITVNTPSGQIAGTYAGMAEDGRLSLVDASGQTQLFWAGDVSVMQRQA